MILSAGLSPAWQQILLFDSFRHGEVNRARQAHWCASGKVFNAGIAAHHLGGPSLTLAPAGGSPLTQIDRELSELGVPHRLINTESATRVCTTLIDQSSGQITELVENGRPLGDAELEAFRQAYAEEVAKARVAVITGSLPVGTPTSFYRDLMEQTKCPAVLDIRGEGLTSLLDLQPYVVKPNREELARTVKHPIDSDDELRSAMQSLNHKGARWVVITQGAGPVWISSSDQIYRLHPPTVEDAVNPIGSGDAMAATIAWATRDGRDFVQAVCLGIAAAAQNLRQLLPCRLDRATVEADAREVRVERL